MADKPPEGLGRGGRGALLLAALKNQPRRPGQIDSGSSSSETSRSAPSAEERHVVEPPALGRGALLKAFAQSRGRPIVKQEEPEPKPVVVARGRALALSGILTGTGRGLPKTETSVPKTEASETTTPSPEALAPSPPLPSSVTSKFEELSIGKYSGTSGSQLKVEVNYVRLKVLGNQGIHEYHVSFNPTVESQRMKFRLMNQQPVRDVIGNVKTFDGSKLYLPRKLGPLTEVAVNMPTDGSIVNINIKLIKMCQPSDCLHLYNLLFRKVMSILQMTQVNLFCQLPLCVCVCFLPYLVMCLRFMLLFCL